MTTTAPAPALSSIADKLREKMAIRESARAAAWDATARAIADGKEPDAEAIEQLLADAGRQLADLEASVDLIQKRRAWAAQAATLAALDAERKKVATAIEAENATLAAAELARDSAVEPLAGRILEIQELSAAAFAAQQSLLKTAPPPVLDRLAQIGQEVAGLNAQHRAIAEQRENAEAHAGSARDREGADLWKQRAARHAAALAEFNLDGKLAALQAEETDLRRQALQP